MGPGRKKGSTNSSSHHKAGGARAGAGRPLKHKVQSTTLHTIFGHSREESIVQAPILDTEPERTSLQHLMTGYFATLSLMIRKGSSLPLYLKKKQMDQLFFQNYHQW